MEHGYLLKKSNGDVWQSDLWQAGMGIVDFTNPAAAAWYQENTPKGEFVLVVRGAEPVQAQEATLEDGLAMVDKLREEGLSLRDAVKRSAKELGLARNQLYDLAVGK